MLRSIRSRPASLEAKGSPWAGMSGAVVVADDLVIGVVRSHNITEGGGSRPLPPSVLSTSSAQNFVTEYGKLCNLGTERATYPRIGQQCSFRHLAIRTTNAMYLSSLAAVGPKTSGPPCPSTQLAVLTQEQLAVDVEAKLNAGSVLLLGKGAIGKTTLATWIAVRHTSHGGQCYYLDLAEVESNEAQLESRLVSILTRLTTHVSLLVIDNVHLNERIAASLLRNWERAGSPGKILFVGRHTLSTDYPEPSRHLPFLVKHVATLELNIKDLLNTYSRIVAKYSSGAVIAPTEAVLQSWLRLFGSDRVAFGFAVRHHLETQGSRRWLARGGMLYEQDAVAHMQQKYLDRWPNAKQELMTLAAASSIEVSVPEEAIDVGLIDEAISSGIVLRTTHGAHAYRRYSLVHPGLGKLLLSAARVKEIGPIFQSIAEASPFTGFILASRLESAEGIDDAARVLVTVSRNADSLIAGLHPSNISQNLDRLRRLNIMPPAEVDRMLVGSNRSQALFDDILDYPLSAVVVFVRVVGRWLPQLHESLLAFLSDHASVSRMADAADQDLGQTGMFLAEVGRRWPALADKVVAALGEPGRVTRLADAADQALGQTGIFLAEVGRRWPALADKVVAALGEPGRVTRLADAAADQDLGQTGMFLAEVGRRWPALADKVVAALGEPGRVTRLADAADQALGQTGSFLAEVGRRWPALADKVVAALGEPGRVTRLADAAADQDLGQTGSFLAEVGRRWPALADKVVAALGEPGRVTRLADAADQALGNTGMFLVQVGGRWPALADKVVAALGEPGRVTRLADAADQALGNTGMFLVQVGGRWPALADKVAAALGEPGRVTRLADAADQALGNTGMFLVQVGGRWPALADKVAAALGEPGRVTRLADAADQALGNTGSFLVQVGRRWPALADKVAAALDEPGRVTRLADAAADQALGNTGMFLVQVGGRWPALADKVAAALGEPGRVTRLADAAADQALHHAGSFLAEVGRRWPALADKVAAALDEPGRVTRLADAADHDLGNTGSFLVQVGRRWPALADKVAAALGEPGRVTRLADAAADHDLGNTGSFLVQVGRRWPALADKVVAALDEPGRVTRLADAFLKGSPSSTMTFLRDCRKLMPTVYSGIMSLVTETDRNEQLANLITRDFRYSGGFLEHLYKNHPEVAERLLHRIIDRGDINSLALRAAPTEGMARSARALIVVAEFFNSIGEKERARRLLENLLAVFRDGYHLGGNAHMYELARMVSIAYSSDFDMQEQIERALAAAGRSYYWLEREFLTSPCGVLAYSLDALWWSGAPLPIVQSICRDHLTDRILDEFALLRLMKLTAYSIRDPLRLAGMLRKYGLGQPAEGIFLEVGQVKRVLPDLIAHLEDVSIGMQVWAGLYVICGDRWMENSVTAAASGERGDWEFATTWPHRSDQQRFKMEMIAWLQRLNKVGATE